MKVKRLLAVAMAATMILGSSTVAFASSTAPTTANIQDNGKGVFSTSVTTSTTFQAPIVKVVVPTSTPVYLNPYGIQTTIPAVEGVNAAVTNSTATVVAGVYKISNVSNVPVKIAPTITTTATGAVLVENTVTTTDLKTKWVKLSATFTDAATESNKITFDLGHKFTSQETPPTITLPAGTGVTQADNGTITGTGHEATLSFVGSLNTPENVSAAWGKSDGLKIVIKYDIYPQTQAQAQSSDPGTP